MSDVPSEGVVIRMAPQPTLGTDASAEWVQLQIDKGSLQKWNRSLQTIERNIHDPYMVNRKGRVIGWQVMPQFAHDFNKDFADLHAEPMLRCVGQHPGGKGQRKYRPSAVVDGGVSDDSFTVPALGDLPTKTVIRTRGFTNSANNGKFTTVAGSVAGAIHVATGTLVAEASPPANAQLGVWGFEGASGDLKLDASGNLTSTTEDFTTRGINVGDLLQLGDDAVGTQFGIAWTGIAYAWVTSVSAHLVGLEHHKIPNGAVGDDAGTGKTIRIRVPSFYSNYAITDSNYAKKRLEGEFEMPNAGADGLTRWINSYGLAVGKMEIAAPLKGKVTATVSYVGTDASAPLASGARIPSSTAGTGPAQAYAPLVVDLADTANDVKFVRLMDAGANIIAKVNNWTLTLDNHVTALETQGTAGATDHIYGGFNPSVKLGVYFDNSAQIDAANNNDDCTWDAAVDNGQYMFAFRMPRTAVRSPDLKVAANTQVTLDFDAPGFGHETTNRAIVLCIFE